MTKKLICLLLAAFLGVSLIALIAACCSNQTPQEPPAQSTTLAPGETALTPTADAASDAAGVYSLQSPTAPAAE